MPSVQCSNCEHEHEISEFMVKVGQAFGLVGVSCEECTELIPAEDIEEAMAA